MKKVIAFALALIIGIHLGYSKAIKDAHLIEANEDMYLIEFNGEVHEYDYD